MKTSVLRPLLLILVAALFGSSAFGQTPATVEMDSNDLYYSIVNSRDAWVEVTFPGEPPAWMWHEHEVPAGHIVFPCTINHDGTEFHVREISPWTFIGCKSITAIDLPDCLKSIGFSAFAFCEGLLAVAIPPSVTYMGGCMFFGCRSLTTVTLPPSLRELRAFMFADCSALRSVELPARLEIIDRSAFDRSGIASVTIPQGVYFIDRNAFRDCSSLSRVTVLAAKPPVLGEGVFDGIDPQAILVVPAGSRQAYLDTEGWNRFSSIEETGLDNRQ